MDNNQLQYIKIQSQYADKVEQFEKCVVKAAKQVLLVKYCCPASQVPLSSQPKYCGT